MIDFTEQQIQRYSRHILLKDVGVEGQEKIMDARVLVVGAGGLGSPVSLSGIYTGRMYVPHFGQQDEMVHTSDFMELSAKLAYTFPLSHHLRLQLNCGVQNIFNAFQSDLDRGEYRDSGYFYGPTQPRTFFVGCKVSY